MATRAEEEEKAATSRYFGAGVVQPVDALTRPLTPTALLSVLRAQPEQTPPVRPPVEQADALHDTRRLAIWVGLVGGASIVVASVLRPLLSRRPRSRSSRRSRASSSRAA